MGDTPDEANPREEQQPLLNKASSDQELGNVTTTVTRDVARDPNVNAVKPNTAEQYEDSNKQESAKGPAPLEANETKFLEVQNQGQDQVESGKATVADYCCPPSCAESCEGTVPECCSPFCTCLYNTFRSLPIGSALCFFLFQVGASVWVSQWAELTDRVPFELSSLGALLSTFATFIQIAMTTALVVTILTEGWCGEQIAKATQDTHQDYNEKNWLCCLASAAWCIGCAGQWVDIAMLYLSSIIMLIIVIIMSIVAPVGCMMASLCKAGTIAITAFCPVMTLTEKNLDSAFLTDMATAMCHCSGDVDKRGQCSTGYEVSSKFAHTCAEIGRAHV